MRTREQIMEAAPQKITDEKTNSYYWTKEEFGEAILEVLLDIRELLIDANEVAEISYPELLSAPKQNHE